VDLAGVPDMGVTGIRELLGRRDNRRLRFQDRFDLRQNLLEERAGAEDHDVGPARLESLGRIFRHFDAETAGETAHIAQIASHFGRIDIDAADDLEPGPRRDLLENGCADRAQTEMQHANVGHAGL
jgi:hypothetical protein